MMTADTLRAEHLFAGYDGKEVLQDVSVTIPKGKISVIIGANACGKSTLLKTLSRLISPMKGKVYIGDQEVAKMKPKSVAKMLGLLPQSPVLPEGIKVADLVLRGRYPHGGFFRSHCSRDYQVVEEALQLMGVSELSDRNVEELSGGQRQRVWIAMALAQETDILLLDEPTTFLDVSFQIEILDRLMELNKKKGTTIVMVLHDLNLSARYADHIFAMKSGKLIAEGTPEDVITCSLVEEVYNLTCRIMKDPVSGSPMMIPMGKYHSEESCESCRCASNCS
jgi:iron complex transport system ATP-binding protein